MAATLILAGCVLILAAVALCLERAHRKRGAMCSELLAVIVYLAMSNRMPPVLWQEAWKFARRAVKVVARRPAGVTHG